MFLNDAFKDCELHTSDGYVFKVHKSVLAVRSTVFEAIFTNEQGSAAKANSNIVIKDIDSKTMKQFLRFVYYLPIENLNEMAHELIYAAEKYQIKELKEVCVESVIKSLNKDNVLRSVSIAEQISDTEKLFECRINVIAR